MYVLLVDLLRTKWNYKDIFYETHFFVILPNFWLFPKKTLNYIVNFL